MCLREKNLVWCVCSSSSDTRTLQAKEFRWSGGKKITLDSNGELVCLPKCMRVLSSPCCPYGFLQVMVSSLLRQREGVSEEDLRITHEATGPLLTFKTGKGSELHAGKLCTARASKELSVLLKILRLCSQTGLTLGGIFRKYNSILLQFFFYHAMNAAVWRRGKLLSLWAWVKVWKTSFCLLKKIFLRVCLSNFFSLNFFFHYWKWK